MAGHPATLDYQAVVPGDPVKNAILTDFGDFNRVAMIAFEGKGVDEALVTRYTVGEEHDVLVKRAAERHQKNRTARGVLRVWKAQVTEIRKTTLGQVATVTACGNESQWIAVDRRTGKDLPNDPEDSKNYAQTSYMLNTGDGIWRMSLTSAEYGASACAR